MSFNLKEYILFRTEIKRELLNEEVDTNFKMVANPWVDTRQYYEGNIVYHPVIVDEATGVTSTGGEETLAWWRANTTTTIGSFLPFIEWDLVGGIGIVDPTLRSANSFGKIRVNSSLSHGPWSGVADGLIAANNPDSEFRLVAGPGVSLEWDELTDAIKISGSGASGGYGGSCSDWNVLYTTTSGTLPTAGQIIFDETDEKIRIHKTDGKSVDKEVFLDTKIMQSKGFGMYWNSVSDPNVSVNSQYFYQCKFIVESITCSPAALGQGLNPTNGVTGNDGGSGVALSVVWSNDINALKEGGASASQTTVYVDPTTAANTIETYKRGSGFTSLSLGTDILALATGSNNPDVVSVDPLVTFPFKIWLNSQMTTPAGDGYYISSTDYLTPGTEKNAAHYTSYATATWSNEFLGWNHQPSVPTGTGTTVCTVTGSNSVVSKLGSGSNTYYEIPWVKAEEEGTWNPTTLTLANICFDAGGVNACPTDTSVDYDSSGHVLAYINEELTVEIFPLNVGSLSYNSGTNVLTYTKENGQTDVISLSTSGITAQANGGSNVVGPSVININAGSNITVSLSESPAGTAAYVISATGTIGPQGPQGTQGPQGPDGSTLITADNGLTKNTATNIRLGGTLLTTTGIDLSGFIFGEFDNGGVSGNYIELRRDGVVGSVFIGNDTPDSGNIGSLFHVHGREDGGIAGFIETNQLYTSILTGGINYPPIVAYHGQYDMAADPSSITATAANTLAEPPGLSYLKVAERRDDIYALSADTDVGPWTSTLTLPIGFRRDYTLQTREDCFANPTTSSPSTNAIIPQYVISGGFIDIDNAPNDITLPTYSGIKYAPAWLPRYEAGSPINWTPESTDGWGALMLGADVDTNVEEQPTALLDVNGAGTDSGTAAATDTADSFVRFRGLPNIVNKTSSVDSDVKYLVIDKNNDYVYYSETSIIELIAESSFNAKFGLPNYLSTAQVVVGDRDIGWSSNAYDNSTPALVKPVTTGQNDTNMFSSGIPFKNSYAQNSGVSLYVKYTIFNDYVTGVSDDLYIWAGKYECDGITGLTGNTVTPLKTGGAGGIINEGSLTLVGATGNEAYYKCDTAEFPITNTNLDADNDRLLIGWASRLGTQLTEVCTVTWKAWIGPSS